MKAYCYASGQIRFGERAPRGAIMFARGPSKRLREFVEGRARHAYDGKTLLVPGVPEAPNQTAGCAALRRWCDWLKKTAPKGVLVF